MKSKEVLLDILSLHKQGLSNRAISRRVGLDRRTVQKYIQDPQVALNNPKRRKRGSKLDAYEQIVDHLLKEDGGYQASLIYDRLRSAGYCGSYKLVQRYVQESKQQNSAVAYMRFETEAGFQAQVDFGEFVVDRPDGTSKKYYCFFMILGYSRKLYAEFIEQCDLPTFLDCHIHAFDYFGGVPQEILYDRMRNVYISRISGKGSFNETLVGFGIHYGFVPRVCPSYSPFVKGKVERPYSFVREGFWRGYQFQCLEHAQRDLQQWLEEKALRVHSTVHERVVDRFARERVLLQALPQTLFDTSWRILRFVRKDCTVAYNGNSYVVAHRLVGKTLLLRVKDSTIRIFHDNTLIVTYATPEGRGHLIQDTRFYRDLREDDEQNRRKYGLTAAKGKGRARQTISPVRPMYELDVAVRPLAEYEQYCGTVASAAGGRYE